MSQNRIIYGGSFDPPHYGHLNTALAVQNSMHFERFIFLPCKIPVLKAATVASSEQRISMLKLALASYPEFVIDTREISRKTPSYMVETLQSFRAELGEDAAITLLIGMDTFIELPQWHSWEQILHLSNLLVIKRAQINEHELPDVLKSLLFVHETVDKSALLTNPSGKIYRFDAGQYAISSSLLRLHIQAGNSVEPFLPADVLQYIKDEGLYT